MSSDRVISKGEPKVFFANERTFLHWMSTAVYLGSITTGIMGIATNAHKSWSKEYHTQLIAARVMSLLSLLLAILIAAYAARNFWRREKMLMRKSDGPFDDLIGPAATGIVIIIALFVMFGSAVYSVFQHI